MDSITIWSYLAKFSDAQLFAVWNTDDIDKGGSPASGDQLVDENTLLPGNTSFTSVPSWPLVLIGVKSSHIADASEICEEIINNAIHFMIVILIVLACNI